MNKTYKREEYNLRLLATKKMVRHNSAIAAIVSVALGMLSLGFLRWVDTFLQGTTRIIVSLVTFVIYMGIVAFLIIRLKRTEKKAALLCPQCNKSLDGDAQRIASATGKCEYCGGLVITD